MLATASQQIKGTEKDSVLCCSLPALGLLYKIKNLESESVQFSEAELRQICPNDPISVIRQAICELALDGTIEIRKGIITFHIKPPKLQVNTLTEQEFVDNSSVSIKNVGNSDIFVDNSVENSRAGAFKLNLNKVNNVNIIKINNLSVSKQNLTVNSQTPFDEFLNLRLVPENGSDVQKAYNDLLAQGYCDKEILLAYRCYLKALEHPTLMKYRIKQSTFLTSNAPNLSFVHYLPTVQRILKNVEDKRFSKLLQHEEYAQCFAALNTLSSQKSDEHSQDIQSLKERMNTIQASLEADIDRDLIEDLLQSWNFTLTRF